MREGDSGVRTDSASQPENERLSSLIESSREQQRIEMNTAHDNEIIHLVNKTPEVKDFVTLNSGSESTVYWPQQINMELSFQLLKQD